MNFIDIRGKWQNVNRSWFTRNTNTIDTITVHHSASDNQRNITDEQYLREIYNAHYNQGWAGISYHLVYIPKSKNWYWINDFSKVTWHDAVNWDSIGVLVLGYYHPTINNQVTDDIKRDLKAMLDKLCTQHPEFPANQSNVVGHRERSATACPGNILSPYVIEYRNKRGNVNWGVANADVQVARAKDTVSVLVKQVEEAVKIGDPKVKEKLQDVRWKAQDIVNSLV